MNAIRELLKGLRKRASIAGRPDVLECEIDQSVLGGFDRDDLTTLYPPVSLRPLDKPVRIFVVGDSHSLPFRDMQVADSFTARDYIVVTKYIIGLTAAGLMERGKLAPALLSAFESEHLFRNGRFSFLSIEHQDLAVSYAAGLSGSAPITVLSVGDIDLRGAFLPHLKGEYDIVLPFETPYGVKDGARIMPYSVAFRMAWALLRPLEQALARLRNLGLTHVLVAELVPPSPDESQFEKLHGFSCSVETRYKATILFNRIIRAICAKTGAKSVNAWDDLVDQRGFLKPEFELDGVHIARNGCLKVLHRIIGTGIVRNGCSINMQRYDLAYKLRTIDDKQTASSETHALAAEFATTGICQTTIPLEAVNAIAKSLDFKFDVSNKHIRLDWVGNTYTSFSKSILTSELDENSLSQLHEILYEPKIDALLRLCMGGEVWYANCRPYLSVPHDSQGAGPQEFHKDFCPPHVLRAILYLVDVDEENGPFEYKDADGSNCRLTGRKGTFLCSMRTASFIAVRRLFHANDELSIL